jgi:hypothetical protein
MNIECNFDLKIAVERQRSFKDFTIEDILSFLERFRKAESVDPLHKWIYTHNTTGAVISVLQMVVLS